MFRDSENGQDREKRLYEPGDTQIDVLEAREEAKMFWRGAKVLKGSLLDPAFSSLPQVPSTQYSGKGEPNPPFHVAKIRL